MLIRFNVTNYLSFNEETEFNMLTGDIRRHPHHVYKQHKIDLLRSAIIYGANGAGKSNLIHAIEVLKAIVSEGEIDVYSNGNKFKLSDGYNKPTKFQIEFISESGKGYIYSLILNEELIIEESLSKSGFSIKEDENLFKRVNLDGKPKIVVNAKYTKTAKAALLIEVYEESLITNKKPFISLANEEKFKSKFKEITEAFDWIKNQSIIIYPNAKFGGLVSLIDADDQFKKIMNELISGFHTGVSELDVLTMDFDQFFGEDNIDERDYIYKQVMSGKSIPVGNDQVIAEAMLVNNKPMVKKIVSNHLNNLGEKVKFELYEESQGTLRLLDLIPAIYFILKYPITVFVDEIDQSIHPHLLKDFIKKIQEDINIKGQLIFTTHESNLLDLELFRQDEIWFAEKNKLGATVFYPLSEYDVRPELDIRKGYLSGRFGAIPFLGDLNSINWNKYAQEE